METLVVIFTNKTARKGQCNSISGRKLFTLSCVSVCRCELKSIAALPISTTGSAAASKLEPNSKIDKKKVQVKQRCTFLSSSCVVVEVSSTFKHVRKYEPFLLEQHK
ncbi:hypothetical protein T01_16293 [Trichinella spiralis]|uniref:Uncharacterized protein n=1 Tax=Trichinella spiralis TaxID=6334 RepID=A0A0V1C336_TRISP|nr:hypothetical protein T01_16293 [Trichinella spiralis]